jgi:hypothetical protein
VWEERLTLRRHQERLRTQIAHLERRYFDREPLGERSADKAVLLEDLQGVSDHTAEADLKRRDGGQLTDAPAPWSRSQRRLEERYPVRLAADFSRGCRFLFDVGLAVDPRASSSVVAPSLVSQAHFSFVVVVERLDGEMRTLRDTSVPHVVTTVASEVRDHVGQDAHHDALADLLNGIQHAPKLGLRAAGANARRTVRWGRGELRPRGVALRPTAPRSHGCTRPRQRPRSRRAGVAVAPGRGRPAGGRAAGH